MAHQTNDIVIQTFNLTHRYGKFTALRNLNLEVRRGEIFGYLGPNGAGKTTTIRTLLDFIRPSAGSATIFGLDTRRDSLAIRTRLGYLPSELTLWENWTGVQYIRWLEELRRKSFMAEAERMAERLEFDLNRPLSGMSTGMKRKIGIIAAMAHKPELLILDEPSNGLDPLMQKVFHDMMREVRAEGRTVFLSSHNLPEVEQICDRVGIIRAGELEAVETIADLTQVSFRWLTFTFDQPIDVDGFKRIAGVSDFSLNGDGKQVRMRVGGDGSLDEVIKCAARHTIKDLKVEQPTLEEVFLTYYGAKEV